MFYLLWEVEDWTLQLFMWNCLFFSSTGRFFVYFYNNYRKEALASAILLCVSCISYSFFASPLLSFFVRLIDFCSESFWFPHFLLCIFLDISLWLPWRWLLMFWIYHSLGQIGTSLTVMHTNLCAYDTFVLSPFLFLSLVMSLYIVCQYHRLIILKNVFFF